MVGPVEHHVGLAERAGTLPLREEESNLVNDLISYLEGGCYRSLDVLCLLLGG